MPNDEFNRYQPPIIPEREPEMEQEQPRDGDGKTRWVGSDQAAGKASDGISDLFEVDTEDDTRDLISVDLERDIIDGDLDDLVEVSETDILGDAETGQIPLEYKPDVPRRRVLPRARRFSGSYTPPTSLGGMR